MASSSSKKVVLAALVGNLCIAVAKFGAATYTGSSAMFSEAIHSVVMKAGTKTAAIESVT